MYYYAYIDADNICTGVYAMPSELNVAGYIAITESQYSSQSVVGMRWNAELSTWEEVVDYFYAVLDENDVCVNVVELEAESTDSNYIAIESLDQTYIGKWYDRETSTWYDEAPFAATAAHSTDDINVGTTNTCLTDALNAKANSADVYTKTEVDDAIAAAGTGGGSGTPGADGADGEDGEDGGYYTPAVASNGDLSWTPSKSGMPAVATVNIKGETGATGPAGATGPQGPAGPQGETGATGAAGADGAPGADGADGQDGVSPTVSISKTGTVTTITITDVNGTHTATINDGVDGQDGDAATIDAYTKTEVNNLLAGKAASTHTHDYAPTTHTHVMSDITGLTTALNAKADSDHTHSEYAPLSHSHSGTYAPYSHTHSNYFSTSGGTVTGETNFSGGLVRVSGVQTLFHSGSQLVFGSNSMPTRIAGSAITATQTITVDSDRSLKENIADVNDDNPDITAADCLNFIDALEVKTYNYKGDSEECIGVIAQDIEDSPLAKYLVRTTAEGKKAVKVADLVFPLIVAVQALSDYVKRLEK